MGNQASIQNNTTIVENSTVIPILNTTNSTPKYYPYEWFGLESVNSTFLNNTQGILFPEDNNAVRKFFELSFAVIIPFMGLGMVFGIGILWWKMDQLLDYFDELEVKAIREHRIRQGLMVENSDDSDENQIDTVENRIARRMINRSSLVVNRGSISENPLRISENRALQIVENRARQNRMSLDFYGFEDPYSARTEGHFRPSRLIKTSTDYKNQEFTV